MTNSLKVDMPTSSIEQVFKMVNPSLELKVTINFLAHPNGNSLNLGCTATFEVFEAAAGVNNVERINPILTVTGNAPRSQDISPDCNPDIALGYFSVVGTSDFGFSVSFDSVKITQIHPDEGERLLAFFKNMFGVKIIFHDDRVGLLTNDGQEERITFPLPYPSAYSIS